MCLAVPARIEAISGDTARINLDGVVREVSLLVVPEAQLGDYVLVHAGFAISLLTEPEARETLDLLGQVRRAEESACDM